MACTQRLPSIETHILKRSVPDSTLCSRLIELAVSLHKESELVASVDGQTIIRSNMVSQEFSNDEKRAMLKAIQEREGRWEEMDPDTEVASIGNNMGLEEDESYALFKQLVKEHYVDPGRILQAGGAMPGRTARVVGRGDELTAVGDDIRLSDKGLSEVADS